ncbi:MAG TPA: PIN domain-containing protein [Verrucomicrobiae bacterium]|jgi:predicted nucleic acid-binding protein
MAQNKKWALDTNVIFDLARNLEQAQTLREIALEKHYSLHITPTSIEEIAHKSINGNPVERKLAHYSLRHLAQWGILLLQTPEGSEAVAEQFSAFLRAQGVLPDAEVNDGVILAEASLAGAALLVSSDSHLAQIDPDELRLLFEERSMAPIPVVTPNKILRIFEKQRRGFGKY